jgi:hypothetical protein
MKVTFVVLVALALGSFASAQSFGFLSVDGGAYCNYEQLSVASSFGNAFWQGTDNVSPCGTYVANGTLAGVTASVSKANNLLGFALKGVAYADNIYDVTGGRYGAFTGDQWFVISDLTANAKKYGWLGLASTSGVVYGDNYGLLTTTIPGPEAHNGKLSTGQAANGQFKK